MASSDESKSAAASGKTSTAEGKPKKQWGSDKSPPHLRFRDFVLTLALTLFMAYGVGFFATKSVTWPLENKYYKRVRWFVVSNVKKNNVVTEEQLAGMTGENNGPVWLSIMKEVYDVSDGRRFYGKDGSYSSFAGRDASRAYATGCFDGAHLTHDIRGLDAKQVKKAADWAEFYRYHDTYTFVGYLKPEPVTGDLPGKCDYKEHQPVSPMEVVKLRREGKPTWKSEMKNEGEKEAPKKDAEKKDAPPKEEAEKKADAKPQDQAQAQAQKQAEGEKAKAGHTGL